MSELASTAVVTGGSRGIGAAIAKTLARYGYQVYLTYVSRPESADAVVKEIEQSGGKARAFQLDVADSAAVAVFFKEEIKGKVSLDVLVNNAGITRDGLLMRMKDEDFNAVINANLNGAFYCLREAGSIMMKQRKGAIINISSISGQTGLAGQTNYSASKAGLVGLTKAAAKELAARNITVNAVAPGFIETDMTDQLPEELKETYLKDIPLKRFGSVTDIAETVAFLASPKAQYITGQVLAVNGGLYC